MKQDLYTIQEVSSIVGVSPKTLRRWEETGKIKPIRTAGNQRRYRLEDVKKLERRINLQKARLVARREIATEILSKNAVSENLSPSIDQNITESKEQATQTESSLKIGPAIMQESPVIHQSAEPIIAQTGPQFINPMSFQADTATPLPDASVQEGEKELRKNQPEFRRYFKSFMVGVAMIAILVTAALLFQLAGEPGLQPSGVKGIQTNEAKGESQSVLAANNAQPAFQLNVNIPGFFGKKVTFLDSVDIKKQLTVSGLSQLNGGIKTNNANINAGRGKLTASNVIYSILPGSNITISGDKQNPTISANVTAGVSSFQGTTGDVVLANGTGIGIDGLTISNTGVTSVQGETGDVTFDAGDGIDVTGTTITNTDGGSAQNIFKNVITPDGTTITAATNNDTINFAAGSGIDITGDSGSNTITITSNASGTLSGLTTNGVLYATDATDATSTDEGPTGTVLHGNTGGAPSFSAVDLTADVTGVLPYGNGGTGSNTTPTSGEILIGNGSGYSLSTITQGSGIGIANGSGTITLTNSGVLSLTGTANEVLVNTTTGLAQTGVITLALPQDIANSSSPIFSALTLSANTNQLILGSGSTATFNATSLTGARIYTLPDISGEICVSGGTCAVSGGIGGTGNQNYLAKFVDSTDVGQSSIYDNGKVGIGTTSPQGLFSVSGGVSGLALVSLNATNEQNIFTASASGTTEFTVDNNGDLQFTGGSSFLQTLTSTAANGKTYNFPTFTGSTADICLSTGNCSGLGGIIGGSGSLNYIPKFTPDGSHIADSLLYDNGTSVGVNTSSPKGLFDVEGAVPGEALTILNYTGTDQNILTGSVSGATKFVFDNAGDLNIVGGSYEINGTSVLNGTTLGSNIVTSSLTSVGTITSGIWHGTAIGTQYGGTGQDFSAIAQGSIPYFSGNGVMGTFGAGSSGQILQSNGSASAPSWVNINGTLNFWNLSGGALSPLNVTNDLLVGGNSTASAKFAFIGNAGTATPVASISAQNGSGNAISISATGTIQTANAQSLLLNPNGLGNVGVGTTNPQYQLDVRGSNGDLNIGGGSIYFGGSQRIYDNGGQTTIAPLGGALTLYDGTNNEQLKIFGSDGSTELVLTSVPNQANTLTSEGSNIPLQLQAFGGSVGVDTYNTGNGALVVNQPNAGGDIFSASQSGNTKFKIANNGVLSLAGGQASDIDVLTNGTGLTIGGTNVGTLTLGRSNQSIVLANYTNCGALTTIGTTLTCSGTPTGTNFWNETLGALSPQHVTDDLLLGGSSTSSAKFAFLNNAGSLNPVASIAATPSSGGTNGLSLSGTGTIQSLNNNTLTIGGNTTGDIAFQPGNNGSSLYLASSGYVGIGAPTAGTFPDQALEVHGNIDVAGNGAPPVNGIAGVGFGYNSSNYGWIQSYGTVPLILNPLNNNVGIGTTTTNAKLDVRGSIGTVPTASVSGATSFAEMLVDQSGSGDLFTASVDGAMKFTITNAGNVLLANNQSLQFKSSTGNAVPVLQYTSANNLQLENVNASGNLQLGINSATNTTGVIQFFTQGQQERARIDANGNLGIGTTSPLAALDVRGTTATNPSASVSGASTFAAAVVDQSGTGDLFTASKSGATKFTILNNGNIQANNYTSNNGLLYTNGSGVFQQLGIGGAGTCLMGGANLTWSSCAAGTNLFQENLGALSPTHITDDLLLGGTSTASARFAFTNNIGSGTPTASISANSGNNATYLTGAGVLGTTNGQTLTLGSASTGDIAFQPGGQAIGNSLYLASSGYVGIGTTSPGSPLSVSATITAATFTSTGSNKAAIVINDAAGSQQSDINLQDAGTLKWQIGKQTDNTFFIYDSANSRNIFQTGSTGNVYLEPVGGFVGIGTNSSIGNDQLVVNQPNTAGDIFSASQSGNTKFVISNSGNVGVGITNPNANLTLASGDVVSIANSANGTATPGYYLNLDGSTNTNGNAAFVGNWQSTGLWGIGSATNSTTDNTLRIGNTTANNWSATQNIRLVINGALGRSAYAALDVSATNATLPIASFSGATTNAAEIIDQSGSGDLFTASKSGATKFTINNAGNIQFGNYTTNQGLLYTNGSGVMQQLTPGGESQCLLGNLTWATCAAGANQWQENLGALSPANITDDFLLGGTSTASAKFAFTNVAGGTPTASIAGNLIVMPYTNNGEFGGNVGIGTTNPQGILSVQGIATNGTVQVSNGTNTFALGYTNTGNVAAIIGTTNNSSFGLRTNNVTRMQITNNGTIGIGTTTPLAQLDVRPNSTNGGTLAIASISGQTSFASLVVDNTGGGDLFTASVSGASKFVINNAGNVGIGTSTPFSGATSLSGLQIGALGFGSNTQSLFIGNYNTANAYGGPQITGNWNGAGVWGLGIGNSAANSYTLRLGSVSPNTTGLWSSGQDNIKLMIGGNTQNSTALGTLDLRADSATLPIASFSGATNFAGLVVDNSGSGDLFTASSSGLTRFVITQNGNVGIGTSTPQSILDVKAGSGEEMLGGIGGSTCNTYFEINLNDNTGCTNYNFASGNSDPNLYINRPNGDSIFFREANAGAQLTLQGGGNVAIGTINPLATFDVRANSGTLAIASVSGSTSFAGLVVDNSGSGDIFTASKSGATKFVINNAGNVGIGTAAPSTTADIAINNATTNTMPLLLEQAGSGDTGLELKSAITSFYVGLNASNNSTFSINSLLGAGANSIIGENFTSISPNYVDHNTNEAQSTQFTANSTGTISSINVSFDTRVNGSSTFSVAIYSDNSGVPGTLLGKHTGTATITTANPGSINWNTLVLDSPVSVTSGTKYWLAFQTNDASTFKALNGAGSSSYRSGITPGTWANWTSMGSSNGTSTETTGIYATINGGNSDDFSSSLFQLSQTGQLTLHNYADSTSAVAVENAASTNLFVADTSDMAIGIGTGTSSLLGTLDVRNTSATTPAASISGASTFANFVVDQSGTGDLFTASKSGATKFTILNNGNIQANNYNTNLGLLYTNGSGVFQQLTPGSANQCLAMNSGANGFVWSTCGGVGAANNYWQLNNGAIAPFSTTADLLLGGTATSAAEFAFTGVDTNTPVASISANPGSGTANGLAFAGATDSIQSLNKNTLTLGGTTTGDIQFKPGNSSSSLYLASNGNVAIGTTPGSSTFTLQGSSNWGVIDLVGNGTNVESSIGFRSSNVSKGSTGDWVIGANTTGSPIGSFNIASSIIDVLSMLPGGNVGLDTSTPGNASLVVNQPNAGGDIFSASQSGNTKFVISNSGNVGIGTSAPNSPLELASTASTTGNNQSIETIDGNLTSTTNSQYGISGIPIVNPGTTSNQTYDGGHFGPAYSLSTNYLASGALVGVSGTTYVSGTGNVGTVEAGYYQNQLVAGSTIGTAYGIYIDNPNKTAGTITTNYGLFVQNQTVGGTSNTNLSLAGNPASGNYSIYNASTYNNYFAGSLGIGTTNPLATLDVRGNIATTPTASISGATTFAEAVVDQSGTGDLFTASKSGATKFVIQNSGNIILGSGLSSNSFGATFASVNGPSTNPFTLYVGDYKQGGGQAQLIGNWQNSTGWGIGTATQTTGDQTLRLAATSNDNGAWSNTVPDLKFLINGPANTSAAGILDVRSSGTNLPIASFSGATTFANTVIDQSGTGDLFTASKSGATKFTIKNSGVVVIGNTTNGIAFDPTELTNPSGQIYYGTARPTRQIVLSPEYAGAVITASGSATNTDGFMTSDASPSASSSQYDFENYYQWVSEVTGTLNSYTVAVKVTLPKDFSGWTTNNALTIDYNTNLKDKTSSKLDVYIYNPTVSASTPVLYDQNDVSSADNTWTTEGYSASLLSNWATAGQTAVIYLKMSAMNGEFVQVGDIKLNYLSAF